MFAYDDAVAERFPTIRAGVIHASRLSNGPSSPELLEEYRAEQRATSERLKDTAIADLASIAAWRRVFTGFGAKPTQYRNAAEALLRRLAKHGDIPTINTLVDIGNLVSIRYAMPVAVFDQADIATSTTTVEALIVVEGHHEAAGRDVKSALTDLTSLLASHQSQGQIKSYVLSPANPRTETGQGVENTNP
jgi:DNA/RNA-binding domain of Phe-tRNA-synthetase-like protein